MMEYKTTKTDDMIVRLFQRMSEYDQEKMTDYMALMNICREHEYIDKNPIVNACIYDIKEWV
jgi:hypothetical protein